MAGQCETNKQNAQTIIENDELKQERLNRDRVVEDSNAEMNIALAERFGLGAEVTPQQIDKFFNEQYPDTKEAEHMKLVHSLQALLDANQAIIPMVLDTLRRRLGEGVVYDKPFEAIVKTVKTSGGNIVKQTEISSLEQVQTPILRVVYAKTLGIVHTIAKGGTWGNFGGIMLQLKTPKEMAYKDKSGAFREIAKGTSEYANKIASRINMFTDTPAELNRTMKKILGKDWNKEDHEVTVGMNDINAGLKSLSNRSLKGADGHFIIPHFKTPSAYDRVQTIFQGIMKGWVKVGDGKTYIAISDGHTPTEAQLKANPQDYIKLEQDELYIFKDYGHIRDEIASKENGFDTFVRHGDGTRVRKWQNLVKLEEFTPPNNIKGSWYVKFSKSQLQELNVFTSNARKIDDNVHTYMSHELPNTVDFLMKELNEIFNGKFTKEELKRLFFTDQIFRMVDGKKVDIPVTKQDMDLVKSLKQIFGMNISNDFLVPDGAKVILDKNERKNYMENHWASLYDTENLQTMLGSLIQERKQELERFLGQVGLVYDSATETHIPDKSKPTLWKSFTKERQGFARKHLDNLVSRINYAERIRKQMAGEVIGDAQLGVIIPLLGQNKYFKRISGAYDIRNSRRDEGVFYDYLKNMMGTLERNVLTGNLVKAFKLLEQAKQAGKIDSEHRNVVMEAATNLYKVPFAATDLEGPLGSTMEGITKKLNFFYSKIPFKKTITRTPEQVQQTFRTVASSLTAMYLGGPGSAITNFTGIFQNVIDYGTRSIQEAHALYKSQAPVYARVELSEADKFRLTKDIEDLKVRKNKPKISKKAMKDLDEQIKEKQGILDSDGDIITNKENPNGIQIGTVGDLVRRMVQESGLTNFNEFFSQSMVNGIANASLEREVHEGIIRAMILYHSTRIKHAGNLKKIGEAEIELEKIVNDLLEKSKGFIKVTDLLLAEKTAKPGESQAHYKKRLKQLKKNRRRDKAHAFVQYAINKEAEFTGVIKKSGTGTWLGAAKDTSVAGVSKLLTVWGETLKRFNLTMGDTEAYIRTISFIIGASRAHRAGQLIGGTEMEWYEYTNDDHIKDAIQWGVEVSNYTNFGLSTQDVGKFNYNGLGNLMGKFKYWSQQKFGRDKRTWQEGIWSLKDYEHITDGTFDWKALYKMFFSGGIVDPRISTEELRRTNPALAQLRVHALAQGGMTLFWDVMMFGLPIPGAASVRAYMFKGTPFGIKATRAIKSDLISLTIFPFTLAAKMALMGDWDDEDFEFTLTYFLRMSFLGYLPMKGWDAIVSMMYGMTDNDRKRIDKTVDTFQPFLGGRTAPGQVIQSSVKSIWKDQLEEDI